MYLQEEEKKRRRKEIKDGNYSREGSGEDALSVICRITIKLR